jgi:hypothetical protein
MNHAVVTIASVKLIKNVVCEKNTLVNYIQEMLR